MYENVSLFLVSFCPYWNVNLAITEVHLFNLAGSSTACLLSLNCTTGLLHTANLGDSGYLVVRNGRVVSKSQDVVHYFNCPYQLSNPPPGLHLNALSDRYVILTVWVLSLFEGLIKFNYRVSY